MRSFPDTITKIIEQSDLNINQISKVSGISNTYLNKLIKKKIKKCKTDPMRGLEFGNPERPECNNLLTLYMLLSGKEKEAVAAECADMGWGQFKPLLTETAIAALQPIQEKYQALMNDPGYLESVLKQGNEKARGIANSTLAKVKDALGYAKPL